MVFKSARVTCETKGVRNRGNEPFARGEELHRESRSGSTTHEPDGLSALKVNEGSRTLVRVATPRRQRLRVVSLRRSPCEQ